MVDIRLAAPLDWEALRAIRLQALREAPHAFASTFEQEAEYTEADWLILIDRGAWFLAWSDGDPVGLVAGVAPDPADAARRSLVSLWVRQELRGTGTSSQLVGAVADWATRSGGTYLTVWVDEDNVRAQRFYDALGFLPSGAQQRSPRDERSIEHELVLLLDGGAEPRS